MQVEEQCENYQTSTSFTSNESNKLHHEVVTKESAVMNPILERTLHDIAKREFDSYRILTKDLVPDGNNYMGIITEVDIVGTTNGVNREENLFVKSILPGKDEIKFTSVDELYNTELYMYTELSKILTKLQDKANVPLEERYTFVKYYKESNSDFIIMENMAKKGFRTIDRYDVPSKETAKKFIEQLAKFHALSFVLQKMQPEYFNDKIKTFKHPFNFQNDMNTLVTNSYNVCLEYLEDNEEVLKRFKNYIGDELTEKLKNYIFETNCTLCMCHGDYKCSNILTRDNGNGKVDAIPVDYQLLNFGSPVIDIMFFIFFGTDKEFRQKHLNYLKNHYYNTLEKFMKYFDLNVEDFYPRESYEREYKDKMPFGLLLGVWVLPLFLADEDKITDFSKIETIEMSISKNDRTKIRIQELVEDFIEWGYL